MSIEMSNTRRLCYLVLTCSDRKTVEVSFGKFKMRTYLQIMHGF